MQTDADSVSKWQSSHELTPFVCGELSSIVHVRIVNPDILDQATSTTRLLAVKYKEPANCHRPHKFDIGSLAGASTKELLRKKEISKGALLRFLNELAAFVPCRHEQNHREDANQVRVCSPVSLPGSRENCHQHHPSSQPFKLVIDHLVKQQHLEGRSSDELIRQ